MAFQMFHSFYYPEYMEETDQERQIFARPFAEVLEEGKGARSRRREGEKHFLSYITLGNPALLKQLFEHAFQKNTLFELGQLSENALRQARYMMICHVTLCSRAAIEGGLPETLAYYMSDSYIRYLDGQTDIRRINGLLYPVCLSYAEAVHEWRLSACGEHVRRCCEYIFSNILASVTLTDLSDVCGLTPNYITELFTRELKMSPMRYIRSQKLEYARILLADHSRSVAQIAEHLSFPGHSNFTEQFRRQYGVTPSQYRKGMQGMV